ncbi:MAG: adenylate/guanylate cyclase domain-containing protein, partial [Geminicoccaceae bacterium]
LRPIVPAKEWPSFADRVPDFEPIERQLERVDIIDEQHGGDRFNVQYGPIGPQWCQDETLEAIALASERTGRRVHMHLLESSRQRAWLDDHYRGGIIRHLDAIGLLSPRLTVAHGVWLREDECALLAQRGVTVAVNTSSNLRLRSGVAPVAMFVEHDLGFALGLDGMAFDDDQDALRDLRLAYLLHAGTDLEPRVTKARLFEAATRRASYVVDGDEGGGTLAAGGRFDLLCLDYRRMSHDMPVDPVDMLDVLMGRMSARYIKSLHVDGRRIVQDGRLLTVELPELEQALTEQAKAAVERCGADTGKQASYRETVRRYYAEGAHLTTAARRHSRVTPASPDLAVADVPAERRQLTVMFCDMVGSTALSARLDPEDLVDILNRFRDTCNGPIQEYGGYVAKFLGDGILAYFGYPQASEDDAERAARAALGIVAGLPEVNESINVADCELKVRIGIATGLVVVGDVVGKEYAERAAVVGETPNVAARLQELAEPNTIIVSDTTRRLLGKRMALSALGVHTLKGVSVPQAIWQVTSDVPGEDKIPTSERFGFELVGRKTELALLDERWCESLDGHGRVMTIVGDAGIGKSHLLQAWIDRLEGNDHLHLACQCSPYHQHSALHPFAQQLQSACEIMPKDKQRIRAKKLLGWLERQGVDPSLAPSLERVLGVSDEDKTQQSKRAAEITSLPIAIADLLMALSRHRPLVVSIEDIHWIDPTSFEALAESVRRCSDQRVFIIATCRSADDPTWPPDAAIEPLMLGRMGSRDGRALVRHTASDRNLPSEIIEEILSKSDGVPLFISELTKAVIETSGQDISATNSSQVPATLQAALSARLDRLGNIKQIVQTAAVLGYSFSQALLAVMTERAAEDLSDVLDRLVEAGLLLRTETASDQRYAFRNALIRDVAYESLLRRRRQGLHGHAGTLIERDFPELAKTEPEMLARHFTNAGLDERAADYWELAGRQAMARLATQEAQVLLAKTLNAKLPETPASNEQEMLLQADLSASEMADKGFDYAASAEAFVQAHLHRAGSEGPLALGRSLRTLVWFQCRQRKLRRARNVALRLLDHAMRHEDRGLRATAYMTLGAALLFLGNIVKAQAQFDQCARHYDPENHQTLVERYGMDPGINGMSLNALCLWLLGFPDKSRAVLTDSLTCLDSLSHTLTVAIAHSGAAWILTVVADDQAALKQAKRSEAYARAHDNPITEGE